MTSFLTPMRSDASRRMILAGGAVWAGMMLAGRPVLALDVGQSRSLVDKIVAEVNTVIASGKSEEAMLRDFEGIFARYADVPAIARSALGPPARSASAAQMAAYTKAFQRYIARKYGRRFREFIGGKIEVTGAQPLKSYYEVISIARLRGQSPFDMRWHISDKGGKPMFFNLIIEGVNMLAAERAEIGAMLDRRRGDIAALTEDLRKI